MLIFYWVLKNKYYSYIQT